MKIVNTLIIDPDLSVREMLSDQLLKENGLNVAGVLTGLDEEKVENTLREACPDVILLGINKKESEQMQLLELFRTEYSELPVIVMTPHNHEGANIALTALKRGAVEYINKTSSRTGSFHSRDHFENRLIPVVKAASRMNRELLATIRNIEADIEKVEQVSPDVFADSGHHMKLLVLVGCLGGVPSLYHLLSSFPENLPVPVIVVQHMPKIYTEVFAEDLNRFSALEVQEAGNDSSLKSGSVYITPGGVQSIVICRKNKPVLTLYRGATVNGYRPSMDILLQSIRNIFEERALVVYLSGGGQDGIKGAKEIDLGGGQIIIQNKSTSLLWDLPWMIEGLGIPRGKYPLERMGSEIAERLI